MYLYCLGRLCTVAVSQAEHFFVISLVYLELAVYSYWYWSDCRLWNGAKHVDSTEHFGFEEGLLLLSRSAADEKLARW